MIPIYNFSINAKCPEEMQLKQKHKTYRAAYFSGLWLFNEVLMFHLPNKIKNSLFGQSKTSMQVNCNASCLTRLVRKAAGLSVSCICIVWFPLGASTSTHTPFQVSKKLPHSFSTSWKNNITRYRPVNEAATEKKLIKMGEGKTIMQFQINILPTFTSYLQLNRWGYTTAVGTTTGWCST